MIRARSLRNQHGSSTVEAVAGTFGLVALIGAVFAVSYIAFLTVWIDREGYEAIVCLSSLAEVHECEADLRKGISSALPVGELSSLNLNRTPYSASVSLRFSMNKNRIYTWSNSKSLPLIKPSRGFF